jgi:alpha-beta hydrolase superfamily lysophospholipase
MLQKPLRKRSDVPRRRSGRRWLAAGGAGLVALAAVVALGPRASFRDGWREPTIGADVDAYLAHEEARVPDLRAGAAKSVTWVDPATRARTRLSLVYLHGFSADRQEVEPLVTDLGRELGANVYFTRLRGHGRDADAMGEASVEDWLDDVAEAVAIGKRIGDHVVLVGTSTGGTLALWAAARPEARSSLAALVLISPNLEPRDRAARVLLWPWGGLLARIVTGPQRCFVPHSAEEARHWTTCYPTRALLPMMALVEHVRTMDLSAVTAPTLVVYSPNDAVVDPAETRRVLARLGGGGATYFPVEESGDPSNHVLAGSIMSLGTTDRVRTRVADFLRSLPTEDTR